MDIQYYHGDMFALRINQLFTIGSLDKELLRILAGSGWTIAGAGSVTSDCARGLPGSCVEEKIGFIV